MYAARLNVSPGTKYKLISRILLKYDKTWNKAYNFLLTQLFGNTKRIICIKYSPNKTDVTTECNEHVLQH